jgi:pimeloyl-ACP methyl ester carboxylesterase
MSDYRLEVRGIPARVYESSGANGLLLLGHSGTLSKDEPKFVELGRRYSAEVGLAVVCIDAPAHGERAPRVADSTERLAAVHAEVAGPVQSTVGDWQAVVTALSSIGPPLAYVGFSMGAMKGLSVIEMIPTIRTAVLGGAGLLACEGAAHRPAGSSVPHLEVAARLRPDLNLLMLNVTRDDMFRPQDVVELFSAFQTTDKRIMFWEAGHGDLLEEMVQVSTYFLLRQFGTKTPAP